MDQPASNLDWIDKVLRHVPLFAGLTTPGIEALCRSSARLKAQPGDLVIEEGTPGDTLLIVLSGELEITKREGDREIVLASRKAGEFLGEMALLEQSPRSASARAVQPTELLQIGPEAFQSLLESSPQTATTILRTVASRLRSTEASLVQSDKLAALGTLAAGLAHELNNPAAAIQSSSAYLREAFEKWRRLTAMLSGLDLAAEEREQLATLEAGLADQATSATTDASTGVEETRLTDYLEGIGIKQAWEIAPALAAFGWTIERVEPLVTVFAKSHLDPVLQWLGSVLVARQLVDEITVCSKAISEIVRAVKSYAYLDQGPVQDVDLPASLEDTLVILRHKLKHGIEVLSDFEAGLPRVEAYAGELNQVWTNLIDNAIQAMDGKGVLELRARRLGETVEVRIADSGPGIAPEIAPKVFDPFFTTKPQGKGTGLGLHIAHNIIVNRHRGRIEFDSHPGRTEFRIVLPIRLSSPKPSGR